jgi:energy-coupling factor transporter ATP-binding protein EcfA2
MSDISGSGSEIFTEKAAFAELLAWAQARPAWQQDALRRLVQNSALSDADIDELLEISIDASLPFEPLSEAHVSLQTSADEAVALLRVESLIAVNALASGQKLEFSKNGLSIVYGDNGSGKSGYVRVLKHACRTRDARTEILRDVEDASDTPQSASIIFARGDTECTFAWTPEAAGNLDLPSVSIFDSRSANVHVEKTNAVAYIPRPMQIMEGLAAACDRLASKIDAKLAALSAQTPLAIKAHKLGANTAAGTFLGSLSANSNILQVDKLVQLSDVEKQRLSVLGVDLAQDSKRATAKINAQKLRLDNGMATLRRFLEVSGPTTFSRRDDLKRDWDTKRTSASLASGTLFSAAPLPGVGEAIWRTLWEAARKYSDNVAYPQKHFPDPTGEGELCVLCFQPLGHEAVVRRNTFEDFVKSSTKADEEAAKKAFIDAHNQAVGANLSIGALLQLRKFIVNEIGDEKLGEQVRQCGVRAAWRLRSLLRGQQVPCEGSPYPDAMYKAVSQELAERARTISAGQSSPEHIALVKELEELKARVALGVLLEDIKAELLRRITAELYTLVRKDTAKNAITIKNKEFSDKLVSNALRGRFAREIDKLKLTRMPVELRKKDAKGVSYFQVCLVERPEQPVGEVFSEGEHRCVALAAFMAELVTSKQYSGIVFDDPMSSLDHIHRKAVAARLVEEARHRQVIVFTHDLTFLFELRREVEAKEQPVKYQTVGRQQDRPGFIAGELPMKAKSALQLANSLRSELKEVRPHFSSWNDTRRTVFSKGFIEQLREAWDQGIADFIFPVLGGGCRRSFTLRRRP